ALNAYMSYRQETMTLARLRHPCLISLIGAYVLSLSYVMELSPLGSLRSVIDE
ncbi:hypothetical protein HELRODRAFT_153781, partial [Helobdella robusta]|uniref:Serine-threonine/tyrosine-protein kinase catalytic domain-containing protein n=1 Tax=Helobdella robusta TaxID=6412 RepID=T1ELB5_HELRO